MCQNLRQFTSYTHIHRHTHIHAPPPLSLPQSRQTVGALQLWNTKMEFGMAACFQKVGDQTCSDVGVRETKGTERDVIQTNVWRQDGETGNMQVQDVISANFLV